MRSNIHCSVSSVVVVLVAVTAGLGRGDTFQVELTTQESLGIARVVEPISGGVPLPPGVFKANQSFTLLDDGGNEVPCQTSPLVLDTDGTGLQPNTSYRSESYSPLPSVAGIYARKYALHR